jgi:DDE superfamily endonuclease
VSHDRLTRMLHGDGSGHTRLELACRTLFVWERGVLISDETVIPKPYAPAMEGLAWVFSSRERRPVSGFALVLLVWTDGRLRVPLGARLWHQGWPSKYVYNLKRQLSFQGRSLVLPTLEQLRGAA